MRYLITLLYLSATLWAAPIDLMLARSMPQGFDPSGWWMSEKYDGVRGYWDGEQLWTRGGHPILAPEAFTARLPAIALDGELWLGRGEFEQTASVVLSRTQDDRWGGIHYRIFDAPDAPGGFEARLEAARAALADRHHPQIGVIEQIRCEGVDHLMATLGAIEAKGGEGVMLRAADSPYTPGRSPHLLKVKSHEDAEAVVVGYKPGQGKYTGMVGSLEVQLPDGRRFFIGSGLSDALRADPPPIGTVITFRFRGKTATGLPRFATFLRVRFDQP